MPDRGRASWRGDVVAALVIGAIAFLPRLLVLTTTPVATPLYDLAEYWDRTVFIIENGRLYENSTRMPGYPVALAIVLTLFGAGPSLAAARIFNAIAGAVAAVLTYWLARRSAGRAASTIAACVMALYPSFLIYTAFTATEAVVTVPHMGALVAAS